MTRYAENTSVSVKRSRSEIEAVLDRYGAKSFRYGRNDAKAVIEFGVHERVIRFVLPLPDKSDFKHRMNHRYRPPHKELASESQQHAAWEQACRQRWRALALAIKAKLEAVEAGISQFEQEFLSHIVNPATMRTVGEEIIPMLAARYSETEGAGEMLMLPGPNA